MRWHAFSHLTKICFRWKFLFLQLFSLIFVRGESHCCDLPRMKMSENGCLSFIGLQISDLVSNPPWNGRRRLTPERSKFHLFHEGKFSENCTASGVSPPPTICSQREWYSTFTLSECESRVGNEL